jgi:hypothetical protein
MNKWTVIQVLLAAVVGFWIYYWTTHLVPAITLPWWAVVLYVLIPPVLMPLIVAASLVGAAAELRRPSWHRNPFVGTDALQNTHEAAYTFLICGAIWFFHALSSPVRPSLSRAPLPLALFFAGIGCWLSVRVCLALFRSRLKI